MKVLSSVASTSGTCSCWVEINLAEFSLARIKIERYVCKTTTEPRRKYAAEHAPFDTTVQDKTIKIAPLEWHPDPRGRVSNRLVQTPEPLYSTGHVPDSARYRSTHRLEPSQGLIAVQAPSNFANDPDIKLCINDISQCIMWKSTAGTRSTHNCWRRI